ncbi:DUF6896 domain-containing protein [Streptomyces massasporeus]
MTSDAVSEIEAYLQALSRVRGTVQRHHPGARDLIGLFSLHRSRAAEKSGSIFDIEYTFHGSGCLFIDANDAEIDVDFQNGREIFDAWRVRRFSTSAGIERQASLEGILNACRFLVTQGRLSEPRTGWFSVIP